MNLLRLSRTIFIGICLLPQLIFGTTKDEYISWWETYRTNPNIPSELREMSDYFVESGLIDQSSNYWNYLNQYNIAQIVAYGYENFKQTVTRNYFTWVFSVENPFTSDLKRLVPNLSVVLPKSEMSKIFPFFGVEESKQFNQITLYMLNYILQIGAGPYLQFLEEPLIGNPPFLTYNGKRISQDVFHSLLEYLPVVQNCNMETISTIVEIGAGSGRTAFTFISLNPNSKYVIVDIPPALYVSQKYLSEVFPDKKVLAFRSFTNFKEIAKEFEAADLVFLTPDQLMKLPNNSADLFLAIDCIHEMKPEIIDFYFNEANRLSKYIYFKCWNKTTVPFDGDVYTTDSYPVHGKWQQIFKQTCEVPSNFFHAMYQIK